MNVPYDYDPYDVDDSEDRYDEEGEWGFTEEDCGRWDNGRLTHSCRLAGSEDCDFECPLRGSL